MGPCCPMRLAAGLVVIPLLADGKLALHALPAALQLPSHHTAPPFPGLSAADPLSVPVVCGRGVQWDRNGQKWRARIHTDKTRHIGGCLPARLLPSALRCRAMLPLLAAYALLLPSGHELCCLSPPAYKTDR